MSYLAIKNLQVRLAKQTILPALDLDVQQGEFLVLLGPSGCGKSTLLQSIAGLQEGVSAQIQLAGRDISAAEPGQRNIGMVFQSYALYPTMNVQQNLTFALRVQGYSKAEIARRSDEIVAMLQLENLLTRKPAQLSGGQKQRVAIGRALIKHADLYLLDEPLSNLDAKLRAELRRDLKLLHQRLGATMVYVTHDQTEAMTLADRIVVMRDGQVQQIGTPREIYQHAANRFVAGFLGTPSMNFFKGEIASDLSFRHQHWQWRCERWTQQGLAAFRGCQVELGLRPEHLSIVTHGPCQAVITLVEQLGHQQIIWCQHGAENFSVLVSDGSCYKPGQTIALQAQLEHAQLFHAASGQAILENEAENQAAMLAA